MADLTPRTRSESFLNGEDLEPITRREHFYAGRERLNCYSIGGR